MTEEMKETKITAGRQLLRDLRELMRQEISENDKLSQIVSLVAQALQMDACSFYLLQPGDILELYATVGLSQDAVHETMLRVGEGLVGEIAIQKKPLSFEDAWHHPSFVYKPETKEAPFVSLMGVPVMRGSQLVGVLDVQTRNEHAYTDDEIETLETVAMVIAQMLFTREEKKKKSSLPAVKESSFRLEGVRLTSGTAIGKVFIHHRSERVTELLSSNETAELERLNQALAQMDKELSETFASPDVDEESADIFETYRMFTKDKGWISKITDSIHSGLTASAAVQKVGDEISERMNMVTDPYLRERIHDFQDLADRLQQYLAGKDIKAKNKHLDANTILVAQSMGPAELLDYDRSKIKALVFEEGSPTMHAVIVAKALNIPVIGSVIGVLNRVQNSDVMAVDGDSAAVYLNPPDDVLEDFKKRIEENKKIQKRYEKLRNIPSVTLDGQPVSLNINAGLSLDILSLGDGMADGIGLYRTELPFLSSSQLPDTQKQIEIYKRVLMNTKGKPVVFRTLDIGSDKVLPYLQHKAEENPAMGWRSIRITLDRRSLLRSQIRAFIRAVNGGELHIMFPMITDIDEFMEAKETLEIELEREREKGGKLPSLIKIGTMIEVPSLLFQMDELLPLVDFISIGSNDLSQFLFATDRSDPSIWERYDVLSAPMIRMLKYVIDKCHQYKVPCSVCGEMAAKPLDAMVLIALGCDKLSMTPASLGRVKAMLLSMNAQEVKEYIMSILPAKTHSLRERLRVYALDHQIVI